SVGVKLSLIAMGVRDLYVNPWPKTKAWDTCAPEAILERAGGKLTDLFGDSIAYDGPDLRHPRGLVASNGHVHDEVIARIAPLFERLRNPTTGSHPRMMGNLRGRFGLVLAALSALPAAAGADPKPTPQQIQQARDLVKKAIAKSQAGDHTTAIELYQQAYNII